MLMPLPLAVGEQSARSRSLCKRVFEMVRTRCESALQSKERVVVETVSIGRAGFDEEDLGQVDQRVTRHREGEARLACRLALEPDHEQRRRVEQEHQPC